MRRSAALLKGLTVNGISSGSGFTQPDWWDLPSSLYSGSTGNRETIDNDFESYVAHGYKANGIVFACVLARLLLFSEARFTYRRFKDGRPSGLFGDRSLSLLERPWSNGTTGELLARMEQDASLAGNSYWTLVGEGPQRRLRRLRPDWVTVISGSESDDAYGLDAQPIGYWYRPPGGADVILDVNAVAHYSPIPDPVAQWRGMSWLTPVLTEIEADGAATMHKRKFFDNGAVAGMAITYDQSVTPQQLKAFKEQFDASRAGVANAYKTLHLGGGADAKALSADFRQLDFKMTQGAGETRIAAAAGVPPIVVGLSEGLQASTYSNYGQARRKFADHWARPHWRMAAASLERLVPAPDGAQLWYDDRDIPFLQEDARESAEIESVRAGAIASLISAGFEPASVIDAVSNEDMTRLTHSGLVSVQLLPPGVSEQPASEEA